MKLTPPFTASLPTRRNPHLFCLSASAYVRLHDRYPVAGNMTVRTPSEAGGTLAGGFEAPSGTPLHVPIFTLQNSTRDWFKPMEFLPKRWMDEEGEAPLAVVDPSGRKVTTRLEQPKCPFLAKLAGASAGAYDGLGFEEGSLSFFPFSAGERSCPGKHLALQVKTPLDMLQFSPTC
jgi:cytochrome P450